MRYVIIIVTVVIVLWISQFAYTLWMRPVDQPTNELRELEKYFNDQKIIGHIYPVRHGFSHSRVMAVTAFEIRDYPLPFGLTACKTTQEAMIFSAPRTDLPAELQPVRNGNLVLDFASWGDDTYSMAHSVNKRFWLIS